MKKSFFIYLMFLLLLMVLILLRLLSISFPRDAYGNTGIVYLDSFPDLGDLFEIFMENGEFYLNPLTDSVQINENQMRSKNVIQNDDIISLENQKFIFCQFPRPYHYKEIFHRPLSEIFPDSGLEVYIGGWLSEEKRRRIQTEIDRQLLKKLIVEIAPPFLEKLVLNQTGFNGKLLCLKRKSGESPDNGIRDADPEELQVASPHMEIKRIRHFKSVSFHRNTWVNLQSGDVLQLENPQSKIDLSLQFRLERVKSNVFIGNRGEEKLVPTDVTSLVVSYKETDLEEQNRQPAMIFLKSFESGQIFPVDKLKLNRFIGDKSLFQFNLMPNKMLDRLYIPDNIHEGGIMDLKHMLDQNLVYRKGSRFYPVDLRFLQEVQIRAARGAGSLQKYFDDNHIEWRHFPRLPVLRDYCIRSEKMLKKMSGKGTWNRFYREIQRVNDRYALFGVGIDARIPFQAFYRTSGLSWVQAQPWNANIPEVSGIDRFYWGNLIRDSGDAEFRFDFIKSPSAIRLISVADFAFSLDGQHFVKKSFLDGVQDIYFGRGSKQLFVRVSNLHRFNQEISQAGFQMQLILKHALTGEKLIPTDKSWESSINLSSWIPAKANPIWKYPDDPLPAAESIWYDETWNPLYRGVKNRYFKKEFSLQYLPEQVSWKINASGEYRFWVNNRIILQESDLKPALVRGKNRLVVMISRKGFSKKTIGNDLFVVRDNRIRLKSRMVQRSSFVRGKQSPKPVLMDIRNKVLGFSSSINGDFKRFFNPVSQNEFQAILGSGETDSWGLEQVFQLLYRRSRVREIRLTIDQEWQKIAVCNMQKMLQENRQRELSNPQYQRLSKELQQAEKQLSGVRSGMEKSDRENFQSLMEAAIVLQEQIGQLQSEINRIKNNFYEASVVFLNPRGQILVAASVPYNESTMSAVNPEMEKPYRPYEIPQLNRAWKWKYNPGSTAKILDSISFLHSSQLMAEDRIHFAFPFIRTLLDPQMNFTGFPSRDLKGSRMLNGKQVFFQLQNFRGHDIPLGFCSLDQALTHSYNTYFGYVALHNHRMLTEDSVRFPKDFYFISRSIIPLEHAYGEYPVLYFAEKMLMNQKIDLLSNLKSTPLLDQLQRTPYDAFFAAESIFPVNAYTPSDIAYFAIGQSDFQLTTLQNALVASTIFNQGCLYYPSIIKSIRLKGSKKNGDRVIVPDPENGKTGICEEKTADFIKMAMKNVVDQGTAAGVFDDELRKDRVFYAKTGTAETKFYPDHSLFIGFVRFRNGSHTIFSVIVPRSGTGAAIAGRLAARILKDIIDWENKNHNRL